MEFPNQLFFCPFFSLKSFIFVYYYYNRKDGKCIDRNAKELPVTFSHIYLPKLFFSVGSKIWHITLQKTKSFMLGKMI